MNKADIAIEGACAFALAALTALAYPLTAEQMLDSTIDLPELAFPDVAHMETIPHQIALSDLICTGTVTSTNDGYSAAMDVDEILWGTMASSNITVRYLRDGIETGMANGSKYLVMAFTNDWWNGKDPDSNVTFLNLYDYPTSTSSPPSHATFDDFRLMTPKSGLVSFDVLDNGLTNYWPSTRAFITNYVNLAKGKWGQTPILYFNNYFHPRWIPWNDQYLEFVFPQ